MIRRPPRPTLFPSTTLFRSVRFFLPISQPPWRRGPPAPPARPASKPSAPSRRDVPAATFHGAWNQMEIFDYDNILLLPRKCRVESRSECDASVELGGRSFRIPAVPANMKTVVDESICTWLAQNGYFYVMHRFDLDNVQFVREMQGTGCFASISLGVKKPDYDTVDRFVAEGLCPEYITIDIAHGHADSVKNMIEIGRAHV